MENVEIRELAALMRMQKLQSATTDPATPVYAEVPLKTVLFSVGLDGNTPVMSRIPIEETLDVELIGETSVVGARSVLDVDRRIRQTSMVRDHRGVHWWRAKNVVFGKPITTMAETILSELDLLAQENRWKVLAESEFWQSATVERYIPGLAFGLGSAFGFDGLETLYFRSTHPTHRIYPTGNRDFGPVVLDRAHGDGQVRSARIVVEDPFLSRLRHAQQSNAPLWIAKAMSFSSSEHDQLHAVAHVLAEQGGYQMEPVPTPFQVNNPQRHTNLNDFFHLLLLDMEKAGMLRGFEVSSAADAARNVHFSDLTGRFEAVSDLRNAVKGVLGKRFDDYCIEAGWAFHVSPLDVLRQRYEALAAKQPVTA